MSSFSTTQPVAHAMARRRGRVSRMLPAGPKQPESPHHGFPQAALRATGHRRRARDL
jgi:hypothetical protein